MQPGPLHLAWAGTEHQQPHMPGLGKILCMKGEEHWWLHSEATGAP